MKFPGIKEFRMLDYKNAKIAESYYHGAEYTREMITHEVARLQRLFPGKEFRVSIPYTRPMSGTVVPLYSHPPYKNIICIITRLKFLIGLNYKKNPFL